MASSTTTDAPSTPSPEAVKDEVSIDKATNKEDHTKCCAYLGKPHECKQAEGKPWREGWQEPDNHEKDELSKKGPATSFMLGRFDEFPRYFNDPSLSEEDKRLLRKKAISSILIVLRREAKRLGLAAPKTYSPAEAERILRGRIQHNRSRQRSSRRHRLSTRLAEKEDFSSMLAGLKHLGLAWEPPAEMDLDESPEESAST